MGTSAYCTITGYWTLCRGLPRTVTGYWTLCRGLPRTITGDGAENYRALLLVTGHCAEDYRALLLVLETVQSTTEHYCWLLETADYADYCRAQSTALLLVTGHCGLRALLLVTLRVRTNAARLRFRRTYGQQTAASAPVSTSIGTPLCYGSRTVAGRRSRESGTGSLSCAGREGRGKEAGCAGPTAYARER